MVFVIIALAAASVYLVVGTYMNSKVHYLATHCWSGILECQSGPFVRLPAWPLLRMLRAQKNGTAFGSESLPNAPFWG